MIIRKTEMADLGAVLEIYESARSFMRDSGNATQWAGGYPGEENVIKDIEEGYGHVCECDGEIVAAFFFKVGDDPTYSYIEGGNWQNCDPYAVIHRIAVKYHGRGIADFIYSECFKLHPNLRIDTHRDNLPMQRSLAKNGFKYCGIIYLESGDERLAYQKTEA